jgi:hypothetical protein
VGREVRFRKLPDDPAIKNRLGKCKKCGQAVVWAIDEQNKKVALTWTTEVYSVVYPGPHDSVHTKRTKKEVYVNHKLTCGSSFNEWSK